MTSLIRRLLICSLAATGLTYVTRFAHAQNVERDLSHLTPEQRATYEAMHARMMAALTYERVTVPGEHALAEWERLRATGRGWPVVVGGDEDLERIADQFSMGDPKVSGVEMPGMDVRSPAQILEAAAQIKFPDDLRRWPGAYQPEDLQAPTGEWPSAVEDSGPGLSVAMDIVSGHFHERVHILLIPAKHSWEVPAYLRWGDWNACPPPEYHVAALRLLNQSFGANLAGINGDTMNIRAESRPRDRNQALSLAHDLYGYCPDIVDQGVGSISALAAALTASEWWYLWWD